MPLSDRPRIAVITPLFPIWEEPYRGKPIYDTVLALRAWADLKVFCPMAVYPGAAGLQPRSYVYRRADPTYQPAGVRTEYLEYFTVPLLGRATNGWSASRRLLPALQAWRPALLLSYWLYPDGYASVQCGRRLGVPVVIGSRGSDLLKIQDGVTRAFTSWAVRRAGAVLTVSEELRCAAIALGADPARVHTVLNGCNTGVFFPKDRAKARRDIGVANSAEIVLFVGHLIASKGVRDLVQAVQLLSKHRPELKAVLVGEGPLHDELAGAAASGLLQLTGAAVPAQVSDWMAASDLVCLPSYSEGCPNVVIEALACGRPVVATRVGAVPDLLNPVCGEIVPSPGDPAALAAAIERALLRSWDSFAIASQFKRSWDGAARETFAVCQSLLDGTIAG